MRKHKTSGSTSPGGGLLKMSRTLTSEEQYQYIRWLESKGLMVLPEDIAVEDGHAVIKQKEAVECR